MHTSSLGARDDWFEYLGRYSCGCPWELSTMETKHLSITFYIERVSVGVEKSTA